MLEFGHKGGQHPQFIHPPQGAFGVAVFQHQIQENALRLAGVAHIVINQPQVRFDQPHGIGVDQHARAQPFFEQAQDIQLICQKVIIILDGNTPVHHAIARLGFRHPAEKPLEQGGAFGMYGFQFGQENARQIPNRCGMAEKILHEMLDRAAPAPVLVAHTLGHFDLQVKCQLVRGAPGDQVQMAAHRPEKVFRLGKGVEFIALKHL